MCAFNWFPLEAKHFLAHGGKRASDILQLYSCKGKWYLLISTFRDEDAPTKIPDEDAVKPEGWLDDEPEYVSDPDAEKPEDW